MLSRYSRRGVISHPHSKSTEKFISWDKARYVSLKSISSEDKIIRVFRCELKIKEDMLIVSRYLGTIDGARDNGRVLVADLYPDGNWDDHLIDDKQPR